VCDVTSAPVGPSSLVQALLVPIQSHNPCTLLQTGDFRFFEVPFNGTYYFDAVVLGLQIGLLIVLFAAVYFLRGRPRDLISAVGVGYGSLIVVVALVQSVGNWAIAAVILAVTVGGFLVGRRVALARRFEMVPHC
jgi:hypothetical protein